MAIEPQSLFIARSSMKTSITLTGLSASVRLVSILHRMEANHVHRWHGNGRLCGRRRFMISAPSARKDATLSVGVYARQPPGRCFGLPGAQAAKIGKVLDYPHAVYRWSLQQNDYGKVVFHRTKAPDSDELCKLVNTISHRVAGYLERQGLLERDSENSYLAPEAVPEADSRSKKAGGNLC